MRLIIVSCNNLHLSCTLEPPSQIQHERLILSVHLEGRVQVSLHLEIGQSFPVSSPFPFPGSVDMPLPICVDLHMQVNIREVLVPNFEESARVKVVGIV